MLAPRHTASVRIVVALKPRSLRNGLANPGRLTTEEGGAEIAGHALHRALPHDGAQRAKQQAAWRARRLRRSDDGRFRVEYLRGERLPVGQTPLQLTPGVRLGESARAECVVRVLELCAQLLDDLELALARQFERLEAAPDEREEIRHSPVRPPPARRA